MSGITIRPFAAQDVDEVVDLSVEAWAPVFASFEAVMGTDLYVRVHPNWRRDQAAAVRQALEDNETWVAEVQGDVVGFVNVIFDETGRSSGTTSPGGTPTDECYDTAQAVGCSGR
jgi:hypothetical protein